MDKLEETLKGKYQDKGYKIQVTRYRLRNIHHKMVEYDNNVDTSNFLSQEHAHQWYYLHSTSCIFYNVSYIDFTTRDNKTTAQVFHDYITFKGPNKVKL